MWTNQTLCKKTKSNKDKNHTQHLKDITEGETRYSKVRLYIDWFIIRRLCIHCLGGGGGVHFALFLICFQIAAILYSICCPTKTYLKERRNEGRKEKKTPDNRKTTWFTAKWTVRDTKPKRYLAWIKTKSAPYMTRLQRRFLFSAGGLVHVARSHYFWPRSAAATFIAKKRIIYIYTKYIYIRNSLRPSLSTSLRPHPPGPPSCTSHILATPYHTNGWTSPRSLPWPASHAYVCSFIQLSTEQNLQQSTPLPPPPRRQ